MPRHKCKRRIDFFAEATYFKPAGVPMRELDEVVLQADELESLRLADMEGLYHEDAAKAMGISRQTFGRVVASARKKVAKALVFGTALRIHNHQEH